MPVSRNWEDYAACQGSDGEWWYPISDTLTADNLAALEICGRCPVREQCLAAGLERSKGYGIWGGMTSGQRKTLRTKERAS
jgi:WhiB family redox-sensing transcriptional regulator